MRYTMPDGKVIEGHTYDSIVAGMAEEKMTPAKNMDNYRRKMAQRVKDMYDVTIDPSSSKALLKGLERHNLVTRMP